MPFDNFILRRIHWLLAGMLAVFFAVWLMPSIQTLQGGDVMPLSIHIAAETFSIVIAMMVFGLVWNAYGADRPGNTLIIACGFLAVGLLDFAHMLSFKGMPDFVTPSGQEKGNQFWLFARFFAALTLLVVALRPWQPLTKPHARYGLLAGSLIVTAIICWLGLFHQQDLPQTFIEGEGLTPFKIGAEYLIIAILLVPAVLFHRQAQHHVAQFRSFSIVNLFAATAITILSELCFTLYSSGGDVFNLLGHLYKIAAYVFIYRAVFVDSVREPFQKLQQAQEALVASQKMLRSIIDSVPVRIFWKDRESRFLGANNLFLRDVGLSCESQLIGKSDLDFFPEHAELYREDDRSVMDTAAPKLNYEEEIKTRDGLTVSLLTSKVPLHGVASNVTGVLGTYVDITEQKLMTARLQTSELEFRTLAENAPNIIQRYDLDCRLIYANTAYERETQIPVEEAMYHTPDIHWRATTPVAKYKQLLQQVMETGMPGELLLVWPNPDSGQPVNYYFHVVAECGIDGQLKGVLAIGHSITALTKAEELARTRSEFLAQMSHELRTPLNGILGYAQILGRDKKLNERQIAGVNVIRQSGEHLLTLINGVLDLAKIDAGKMALNLRSIKLDEFLHTITGIMRVKVENTPCELICILAPDLPAWVRVDENRLRQVLLNLLANAVKFTERGRVSLQVKFLHPGRLRFEVQDTGIGIAAEQLETIFQSFEQVGENRHRFGGTGLGLSISRQLVQLMGSDIHVMSKLGHGSIFWFEIDAQVMSGEVATSRQECALVGYAGCRRTILIVDDVKENRAVAVEMLAQFGFKTIEAADGSEALEIARTRQPDLILMDTVMPGMNGLEAMRRLRQLPGLEGMPVISVSASAFSEEEARSLVSGANAFLPKPLNMRQLMSQIAILLKLECTCESAEMQSSGEPLIVPPVQEMEILHHLAQTGNMRDILQRTNYLIETDERYRPFAEQLRGLALGYQSRAILSFVEQYLDVTPQS